MEVIACNRHVVGFSLFLFLFFLMWCTLFNANAQPGFLSIDSGGEANYTDLNTTITWVTDDDFIQNLGEKAESYYKDYYDLDLHLGSLRVFPKPLNKSCYTLPLTPNVPHLLRLWFVDANLCSVQLLCRDPRYVIHGQRECDDPVISAIELRLLKPGMYDMAKSGTILSLTERDDMRGGDNITRYPQDQFDRLWYPWWPEGTNLVNISESISVSNTKNIPPLDVMQTAVVSKTSHSGGVYLSLEESKTTGKAVVILYFAKLNSSEGSSISVGINNVIRNPPIKLVEDFSATEVAFQYNPDNRARRGAIMSLQSNILSQTPIINAHETYSLVFTHPATSANDVNALREVGKALSLKNWISDPFFGLFWQGIICKNVSKTIRISKIHLSGRHLRGPIPSSFRELDELVSMSLDNNYFDGTLPNLSSLLKLEILILQHNSFSGQLPEWISKLSSLKELSLNNNYFNGMFPNLTGLSKLEILDLMLVYDYMSGGSVSDNLYDPEAPKYPQLDWKTRLKIALDAAEGLEYLHVGCTAKIIHRDVKTSNILLDSELNGKLADFGISRVTGIGETSQIDTTIKGTPGYLDPMYYRTHILTDKSDVYSFGVVLFELICGRKPIDLKVSAGKTLLTEWVVSYAGVDKDGANS
ncbi:hypothetical protein SUGI_0022790 [Cryptomeria japonica]|nr:hypothetical protein SUGI_0022790 [Cryptomeria japonica]